MRFALLGLCLGLAGCVRGPSAAPEAGLPITGKSLKKSSIVAWTNPRSQKS